MAARTEFSIVPTQEELDRLDRELQFFPVVNDAPETLTREQVSLYNGDGYLRGLPALDADEIAAVRDEFDALLDEYLAQGKDSYSISSAHLRHGVAYDLLTHPKILAPVRDLLGEDVIGWGSHFFCKMPHDGKRVSWHQDATYWPLTPSRTCTVWLAIDDATVENACMRFVPGSHLAGPIDYQTSAEDEGNVLNQTVVDIERFGRPVDNELPAGEFSIHADLLLHGSEANESDKRRCGLTLRYCAAEVRAHLGWNEKGVVVAGSDPSGHWANPGRPE